MRLEVLPEKTANGEWAVGRDGTTANAVLSEISAELLNAAAPQPGEVFLAFGDLDGTANLSETGDLAEAASKLYALLRALDAGGAEAIAIAPIPETGLGEAINDRLRRAAEGR